MGTAHLRTPPSNNGTTSNVGSSLTSVEILAANANRNSATITNDSNSRLILREAVGAAAQEDQTIRLEPQQFYRVTPGYRGVINGIWAPVVSGFARVTEHTP